MRLTFMQACIQESKRVLGTFEKELQSRRSIRPRPVKFDSGKMRAEDEQAIQPVGYIVQLG